MDIVPIEKWKLIEDRRKVNGALNNAQKWNGVSIFYKAMYRNVSKQVSNSASVRSGN